MLTAMTISVHKKEGFASGIDDYMTESIDYKELIWRIEALRAGPTKKCKLFWISCILHIIML
jgi:DNA-binding response OmpR family regulator